MTPKQERFVEQYLIDLNATQAAIRAGYSEKTANEQGAQLLKKPEIAAAIDAAKIARSDETKIDAAWVLIRLAKEAEADLADIFNAATGDLLPVHEWPEIWRRGLVAGIDVEALFEGQGEDRKQIGQTKKIKLSDRVRRIELIGKHIGVKAFETQVSVNMTEGLAERLARARMRANEDSIRISREEYEHPSARSAVVTYEEAAPVRSRPAPEPTSEPDREAAPPGPKPAKDRQPSPEPPYRPVTPWPEPKQFSGLMDPGYVPFKD